MSAAEEDFLDGCDIDFTDPATVTTDDQAVGIVCFGDLHWVGERDGVPVCDPDEVAARKAELEALDA